MGSSSLAARMIWCRVLALLTVITFVFSNQSSDTKNRAVDTSLDNSLNNYPNHIITKRDAKDPEKKRKKKTLGKRRKNTNKASKKKRRRKNKQRIQKKNDSKSSKKGKKKRGKKRIKDKKKKITKKNNKKKRTKKRLRNNSKRTNKGKKRGKKFKQTKKRNKGKKKKGKEKKDKQKLTKKQRKERKQRKSARQGSCASNEANYDCMAAALKGMLFEQQQITNYLKQSKLLQRHQDVTGNKRAKKNTFEEAEQHLIWAIGGDIDNPICGPSDTSSSKYNSTLYEYEKNLAVQSYKVLKECDIAIEKACNISLLEGYDKDGHAENTTLCQDMKKDAIANNKRCQSLTDDVSAQCACWINQTIVIDRIKEFKCSAKATQKLVTKHKNACIETFKECKKKEDKSVESVYYCMHDHSMKFINQTTESLANAATKNSKTAAERNELGQRNLLQLQEYLEDFDKALLF